MSFELHITCSKDIDKLNIDFSDGTSAVTESKPRPPKKSKKQDDLTKLTKYVNKDNNVKNDSFLDVDFGESEVSNEVVEKPDITIGERPVKVAEELQNLDI